MKTTAKLLVAALAVAGLAVTGEVQAQSRGSHGGAIHGGGAPHWGGTNWGHGRSWSRGYWSGPRVGLYIGAPLLLGAWGWPYYYGYDWDYPRSTVIYREVERYPQPYGEEPGELLPSTQIPPGEGAPTQGPLYMNYCESAKAYFPKVTTCPEGWRLATPAR